MFGPSPLTLLILLLCTPTLLLLHPTVEEADQMQQSVRQYGVQRGFRHYFLAWWNKVSQHVQMLL
jgi:hypothetical protein